jgi:TonB family protein
LEKLFREQDFSDQKALRRGGLAVALLVVLFAILSFRYNTDPTLELTEEIPKNLLQVRTQQESPIEESSTPEPAFGPEPIAKEQAQPANQESQTPQQAATVTPTQADPAPARPSAAQSLSRLQSSRLQNMLAKASESTTRTPPVATSDGRVEPSLNTLSQLESKLSTGSNGDGTATASKAQIQTGISSGSVQGLQIIQQGLTGRNRVSLLENDSEVEGGLDREVIATYIRSRIGEILYCYERQLSSDPSLAGKVGVHFKIGPSGAVETQSIRESTLRSQVVENCILQKISRWKFPAPKGGIQVVVTYPFLFRSTN